MASEIDKVTAILKYWDIKADINQYKWRFFIQKIIYLSKALGIPINYRFSIYLMGPYSPSLSTDYYQNSKRVLRNETEYSLSPNEIDVLKNIKDKVLDEQPTQRFLEGLSTIIYFMRSNPNLMDDELFTKVKKLKPYLSDKIIVLAINKAKELLFKSEYLTEELNNEILIWDKL